MPHGVGPRVLEETSLGMRLLIVLMLVAIVASLAFGLRALLKPDPESPNRMRNALTLRIVLSVALFVLLLIAWALGLIEPHGLSG